MLQITKQILCFVVCTAITCGCTTTSTRTLLKYQDDGRHLTPIESYKIEQETTTYRRSKFKEVAFPIYRSIQEKDYYDPGGEYAMIMIVGFFIPLIVDVLSIPVAAVTFDTDKSISYKTSVHARGKVVNINNQPLVSEDFTVVTGDSRSFVTTDEQGVFEYTDSNSQSEKPNEDIQFLFRDRGINIVYEYPFEQGNRNISTLRTSKQSSLPVKGNVFVLETAKTEGPVAPKASTSSNNMDEDEIARKRAKELFHSKPNYDNLYAR